MAFGSKKAKLFSEINITPLTDIFLVLLIIMMVVAPTFQSMNNNVTIPEINNGTSVEEHNAIVSVTKDGRIFLNETYVTADNLAQELTALKPSLENPDLVVKADAAVKSSEIMTVMNAAQDAEYKKLIVAGEPLSKKEQKNLKDNSKNLEEGA